MSGPDDSDDQLVELVKIAGSLEADLLAAYLDQAGLEFQMLDKTSAPVLASMLPRAQRPVTFAVRQADLVEARKLVEEYDDLQSAELSPAEPPPKKKDD